MDFETPTPPAGSGAGIREYLGVFSRRIWLVLIPFLVVTSIATALAFLLPEQYLAKTVVEVEDNREIEEIYSRTDIPAQNHKLLLRTIKQVILQPKFLGPIIERHDVTEGFDLGSPKERDRLFKRVFNTLKIDFAGQKEGSDIISISYVGRGASKVASFVNDVRGAYIDYIEGRRRSIVRRVLDDLEGRLEEAETTEKKARDAMQRFRESHESRLIGNEKTQETREKDLARTRDDIEASELQLDQSQKELDTLKAQLELIPADVRQEINSRPNPDFIAQKRRVVELETTLTALLERLTEIHPSVVAARKELAAEELTLEGIPPQTVADVRMGPNKEYQDLLEGINKRETDISGLSSRIKRLKLLEKKFYEEVQRMPELSRQRDQLEIAVAVAADETQNFRRSRDDTKGLMNRLNSPDGIIFKVLRAPSPEAAKAWDPVFPSVPLFVGVGAFIGLLLGAGMAFLKEFSTSSFVTVNQVRRTLNVPLLGSVGVIERPEETRARKVRTIVIWCVVTAFVLVTIVAHVCFFQKQWRDRLPIWLYTIMKRFYGSR